MFIVDRADGSTSVRRSMFIVTRRRWIDLRQEVHVFSLSSSRSLIWESSQRTSQLLRFTDLLTHPENPFRCIRLCRFVIGNMDLLTEVGPSPPRDYKHGPPDGGRLPQRCVAINMDLLP